MEARRTLDVLSTLGGLDLGLVLTHACNLACAYCYTGAKKRVRMTRETAEHALDLGLSLVTGPDAVIQLTFFGGEPLLEHELLVAMAEEARGRTARIGCRLLLQVTTNGMLLDAELAQRLFDLGVHVALSVDGTRAQHEAGRPRVGGGSSYDAAMKALDVLVASGRPFDVVSVVDPCNVGQLAEGVRELTSRGVEALTLNMNWGADWREEDLATFERQLEEVAASFVAWLRRGRWVRIQPLEGAIQGALHGSPLLDGCHSGMRRIAVAPSGRIYPCPRAVGEDTGRGAIGHLSAPLQLSRAEHCVCARVEETGDARRAGAVLLRHDAAVTRVADRVASLLEREYDHISVVEERMGGQP